MNYVKTQLEEMEQKSNFISNEYLRLAKVINPDIHDMSYVHHSITGEEFLIIWYKTGFKRTINITCDSLKAIVFDSIIKL